MFFSLSPQSSPFPRLLRTKCVMPCHRRILPNSPKSFLTSKTHLRSYLHTHRRRVSTRSMTGKPGLCVLVISRVYRRDRLFRARTWHRSAVRLCDQFHPYLWSCIRVCWPGSFRRSDHRFRRFHVLELEPRAIGYEALCKSSRVF